MSAKAKLPMPSGRITRAIALKTFIKAHLTVLAVMVVLELFTVGALGRIEQGKSGSLWRPLAGVYTLFGYWPTVMAMPLIYLVILCGTLVCLVRGRLSLTLRDETPTAASHTVRDN